MQHIYHVYHKIIKYYILTDTEETKKSLLLLIPWYSSRFNNINIFFAISFKFLNLTKGVFCNFYRHLIEQHFKYKKVYRRVSF